MLERSGRQGSPPPARRGHRREDEDARDPRRFSSHSHRHHHRDHPQTHQSFNNSKYGSGNVPPPGSRLVIVPDNLPGYIQDLVNSVAHFVSLGGSQVEAGILEHIRSHATGGSMLDFLTAPWNHPLNIYYRWRLYSFLQGDKAHKWRTDPYQIVYGSEYWWVPPPLPGTARRQQAGVPMDVVEANRTATSTFVREMVSQYEGPLDAEAAAAAAAEERHAQSMLVTNHRLAEHLQSKGLPFHPLPRLARQRWVDTLRELTSPTRDAVGAAMVFALDHSYFAYDVISLLLDSIDVRVVVKSNAQHYTLPLDPIPIQYSIARLFVLHDVLMNVYAVASAPKAAPRNLLKACEELLPPWAARVEQWIVAAAAPTDQPAAAGKSRSRGFADVALHSPSAAWQLTSWLRVLWATWVKRSCVSAATTQRIERDFHSLFVGDPKPQAT